jgi:hypothetical protein
MEHGTYIRVYGAMKGPHLLPWFVSNKLVLQEVAYQTIIHESEEYSTEIRRDMATTPTINWRLFIFNH